MASSETNQHGKPMIKLARIGLLALVFIMLVLCGIFSWSSIASRLGLKGASNQTNNEVLQPSLPTITASPILPPQQTSTNLPEQPTLPIASEVIASGAAAAQYLQGTAILSIVEGSYAHLFVFLPQDMSFSRLTMGDWQDISPALSPDGRRLAFASNRGGFWDLYLLELDNGKIIQLTDTPDYEGSPSWSPDSLWLAYEAYISDETGGNLEIFVRPVDGSQDAIRLTKNLAADYDPAWSPEGRSIAFVSTQTGEKEIWIADLDKSADMFANISRDPTLAETSPACSPVGGLLCWAAVGLDGVETLRVWDSHKPNKKAIPVSNATLPAWGPTGEMLLAVYDTPNRNFLTGFNMPDGKPFLPLLDAGGEITGLTWGNANLAGLNTPERLAAAEATMPPLWLPRYQSGNEPPGDRVPVVPLAGVQAPIAMLQDRADEAFMALRERVSREVGWDFLSVLDQAYVPLTNPLEPGFLQDWLYTARAFQFNSAPFSAGWVMIVREDYGPQTYWRVYLRTRFQDGAQGMPLKGLPWDLDARHSGDPRAFEGGGLQMQSIPAGYWVDFTRLAASFGWERLPSLFSWQTAYSSVRYNEYVLRAGLDWLSAMLEIYPREALDTPTPVSSPTITPTFTSTLTPTPTSTQTRYVAPTATASLTRRPTLTPSPRPSP